MQDVEYVRWPVKYSSRQPAFVEMAAEPNGMQFALRLRAVALDMLTHCVATRCGNFSIRELRMVCPVSCYKSHQRLMDGLVRLGYARAGNTSHRPMQSLYRLVIYDEAGYVDAPS